MYGTHTTARHYSLFTYVILPTTPIIIHILQVKKQYRSIHRKVKWVTQLQVITQGGFAQEFMFLISTCTPSRVRMLHDAKSTSRRTIQSWKSQIWVSRWQVWPVGWKRGANGYVVTGLGARLFLRLCMNYTTGFRCFRNVSYSVWNA